MARETVRVSHQTWDIISRQNSTYTIYLHPTGSNSFPASICHFPVPTHVPVWNHSCPEKSQENWIPRVSWAKLALFFAGGKGGKSPWKDMNMHQNFLEGSVSLPSDHFDLDVQFVDVTNHLHCLPHQNSRATEPIWDTPWPVVPHLASRQVTRSHEWNPFNRGKIYE